MSSPDPAVFPRLVVFGEALTDLIRTGPDQWRSVPGGSCWNVARVAATLGLPTAWAGAVSADPFGQAIVEGSIAAGLDRRFVQIVDKPPLLAVVHELSPPAYFFIGNDSADLSFDENELPAGWVDACEIAHFGCISLVREPLGSRLVALAEQLKQRGVRISFDPNHRHLMDARYPALFERMARIADVLKASEEDLAAIYPGLPLTHAIERIRTLAPTALLLITKGRDGMQLIRGETMFEQPSFTVTVADTVGAGDASLGGFIASLLTSDNAGLQTHLRFASATAAVVCSRSGAHAPSRDEVLAILGGRADDDRKT
ncbi:MAG TPA: carbohydrate kinase [Solimonas sp.]|nr:carbohydrate kinase [Solimonas sp.]